MTCPRCDGQGRIVAFTGPGSVCSLCLGTGRAYQPAAGPLASLANYETRRVRLTIGGQLRPVTRDGHRFRLVLDGGLVEFRLDGDRPVEWATRGLVGDEERAMVADYCAVPCIREAA